MSLFLILGPALFSGILLTNGLLGDGKAGLRAFLQGLATSLAAITVQYLGQTWFPILYGSFWGLYSFWYRDFLIYSLISSLFFLFIPALRDAPSRRRERFLSFLLGSMAPAGLFTFIYLGMPRDIYFALYLPLLRIALALILSYAVDKALSEYGGMLALWIGLAVLSGPLISLVPVFHFWNMPYLSLPLLALALGLAYLSLFGWGLPMRKRA